MGQGVYQDYKHGSHTMDTAYQRLFHSANTLIYDHTGFGIGNWALEAVREPLQRRSLQDIEMPL